MMDIVQLLSDELSLKNVQVQNVLDLMKDGGTVPFIARYRKERTGALNEITLRDLSDRYIYLSELEARKLAILQSIDKQGKLTPELKQKIEACMQKNELEDLYLPYKPKKRTRAAIAKEKGLEPFAKWLQAQNTPRTTEIALETEAQKYLNKEKEVETINDVLQGASDILAEAVAENAELRSFIRNFIFRNGFVTSKVKKQFSAGSTKYENYREFKAPVRTVPAHNVLALIRGEKEGVVSFQVEVDEPVILTFLEGRENHSRAATLREFYHEMLKDSLHRLLKPSLVSEVLKEKKQGSDEESIGTFAANLRELLLSSPAGMKPTMGIDPGFRTGCKVVVIDGTGKFLDHQTIYPHTGDNSRLQAEQTIKQLLQQYQIDLVAIGNGTAGRETDQFIETILNGLEEPKPIKVMVSEAGASIYSASDVAIEEFSNLDVTVRGAISIARRLQDPLAELVKIEPKSIGVGQYQHDVDQKQLKTKLEETVESCVNYVGVDLNTASKQLLSYVAGINTTVAEKVIEYRNTHGAFKSREELLTVPRFGPKTFEQASGFLRIRDGENLLDNTGVHPESYNVVKTIAADLGVSLEELTQMPEQLAALDLSKYVTDTIGEPTLIDIIEELQKPGRDPRSEFSYATFRSDINTIDDLEKDMMLEGIVTNVTNFGAFVDIGVHQDGLVHISQMANHFVKDPTQVVKVGQIIKVRVIEIDHTLKRIGLSMKIEEPGEEKESVKLN